MTLAPEKATDEMLTNGTKMFFFIPVILKLQQQWGPAQMQ